MRRKLLIICMSMVLVLCMSAPAFAASGYNAVSKVTYTIYETNYDGSVKDSFTGNLWYKYNKKKDLTKVLYTKDGSDYYQYDYKYKNGKKKSMTISGGSWDGTKVTYNSKGRYAKVGDSKYYYNSKGYVSRIQHKSPWELDGRYKETWKYTYNGSKLKTAYHKVMKKNGGLIETDRYTFNSKGLPTEWIHTYEKASENYGNGEDFIYTYKYKNNRVKSVTKKELYTDEDGVERSALKEKYKFTYSTKKISASRYRMMVLSIVRLNEEYYNFSLPGSWF